eukprot:scaffold9205_cov121-Isochrysis_galbana.AAC.5
MSPEEKALLEGSLSPSPSGPGLLPLAMLSIKHTSTKHADAGRAVAWSPRSGTDVLSFKQRYTSSCSPRYTDYSHCVAPGPITGAHSIPRHSSSAAAGTLLCCVLRTRTRTVLAKSAGSGQLTDRELVMRGQGEQVHRSATGPNLARGRTRSRGMPATLPPGRNPQHRESTLTSALSPSTKYSPTGTICAPCP